MSEHWSRQGQDHGRSDGNSSGTVRTAIANVDNLGLPRRLIQYSKSSTLKSSALTGQEVDLIGFRQSVRDRFSSNTPRLQFETVLEIPSLIASGCEFRFRTSVNILSKTDSVLHIPAINFIILRLELLDFTFVRAPYDRDACSGRHGGHHKDNHSRTTAPYAPYSGKELKDYSEHEMPLNSLPDSVTVELEQPYSKEKKQTRQVSNLEVWFAARTPR